jgi:hypothetical protein
VWGGTDINNMKLLTSYTPEQPKEMRSRMIVPVLCKYSPAKVKYMKLVVKPVSSMPKWHQQKKHKALLFIDEVFVN